MQIDVAKAIQELLYEHDLVIVPGLGGFQTSPAPASADYVSGVVSPPAKKIEFNPNLVINDGVLVNHIQQTNLTTAQQALEAIDAFVEGIKAAMDRREITQIPEIGRLYKDFEQKIRFMPDGTNFNVQSFGLPNVQFKPVTRDKPTPVKTGSETRPPVQPRPVPKQPVLPPQPLSFRRVMPWIFGLALLALIVSAIMYLAGDKSTSPDADLMPRERLNVKPAQDEQVSATEDSGQEITSPVETEDTLAGAMDNTKPPTQAPGTINEITPEPTPPASTIQAFIVVHSFGQKKNADKFSRQLTRSGYQPTTKRFNGLYRVGIEQKFSGQKAVDDMILEMGKKFNASPVAVDY